MLFIGLTHYMTIIDFVPMVSSGLGPLEQVGVAWAYVLPGLLVAGGLLYALGMYLLAGTWMLGIGLASIPAGLLLKPVMTGMTLTEAMPPAVNSLVWIAVFLLVTRCCAQPRR